MTKTEILDADIKKILPENGPSSDEIKKYLDKYLKEKIVIKCGGAVLLDPLLLDSLISDVAILKKLGLSPILVHGGGSRIGKKLNELNIESKFIMGLRITDKKMINVVEDVMVKFNKEIITALEAKLCKAKSINIRENNIIFVKQHSKELGYVGKPNQIKSNILNKIIDEDFVPVITPMGMDKNEQAYNINADTAAGAIATELKSRRLLLITDVEGVLDKEKNLITEISSERAEKLVADKTISGGMIPKIRTSIDAAKNGVRGVVIIDGRKQHSILFELFSDKGAGTLIRK